MAEGCDKPRPRLRPHHQHRHQELELVDGGCSVVRGGIRGGILDDGPVVDGDVGGDEGRAMDDDDGHREVEFREVDRYT